jgi:hypothetical protein
VNAEQIEVYISYRWRGDCIALADDLQACLSGEPHGFRVLRDNTEVGYKGDLGRYMAQLGNGRFVIVILSDGYLRSRHCMKELVMLRGHADFHQRIFPIVLPDADIRKEARKLQYKRHWEMEKAELQKAYDDLIDKSHSEGTVAELSLYDDIQDSVLHIVQFLDNMHTASSEALQAGNWKILAAAIQAEAKRLAAETLFQHAVQVGNKPRLNPGFKFACDRTEQFARFNQVREVGCKPARFLFLPGEEAQSHRGFAERMKLELEGEFLQTKQRELHCSHIQLHYPEPVNKDYDITDILADMHDRFGLDADRHTPILQRRFGKLLQESPSTSPLRDRDLVLISLMINDFDLTCEHVSEVIVWFNTHFFDATVFGPNAPDVIVLWSLLYTSPAETEAARQQLASLAKAQPDFVCLPELKPVEASHLKRWLQRHAIGLPLEKHTPWISSQLQGRESLPMSYVENALETLITRLNNGDIHAI